MYSYSTRNRKFKKNSKKNSKNQRTPSQLLSWPKQVGKCQEREKIKKIVSMCAYPTCNRKLQKNCKKIRKYHHSFFSSQNRLGKAEKERKEKKLLRCIPTRPVQKILKKKAKKFKKLENTFIAFFQAKIGWERVGKRESKKSLSDVFLPDP